MRRGAWRRFAARQQRSQGGEESLISDLWIEPAGGLDPALDALLGREQADPLVPGVGFGHLLRKPARVSVSQLPDGIDTRILEQLRVGLAHAFDAHTVGEV